MIEIVTFRLRTGADGERFAALDARLQTDFFYHQPGLERRTTARSADGSYVCTLHWDGIAAADTAAAMTTTVNEYTTELTALIEPASISARRYDSL